ncbi:MAG: PIG-L family deacetylase [Deltaproteobacteria bacterium]|nr:PIG-L family deacetylase [Deltaproteobacteria bacterium]
MNYGPVYLPPNKEHLDPDLKHVFVFAHQDDEVGPAGTISRLAWKKGKFLWVTNGDGLAPMEGVDPDEYAKVRMAEAFESARRLGVPSNRVEQLAVSEIEIYDRLLEVAGGGTARNQAMQFFRSVYDKVESWIEKQNPDIAWSAAWQGQHPEHDLAHFFTALALKRLEEKTGKEIPMYEFPEYEFVILVPLRFKPWRRGVVHRVRLNGEDMAYKMRVYTAYPSQDKLFGQFESIITALGNIASLTGNKFDAMDYLQVEEFAPVPKDRDYTAKPHILAALDYMLDKHKGIRIRFESMIRPIVEDLHSHVMKKKTK